MSGGYIIAVLGLVLAAIGLWGLSRKQPAIRPWQPSDGISLIELGISKIDPNFVPAGEMRWEQKLNRLMCWFGVFAGVGLATLGLAYGQD